MPETTLDNQKWPTQFLGHPLFWLAITLFGVLVAYIWLTQNTEELPLEAIKKLSPEEISNNIQQIENVVKQESLEITNNTDKARAQEYIEVENVENSINPLLEAAIAHIADNQYTLPTGDNAWNDYQQVLVIAPENLKAKTGLTKVRNQLIDNAETAIEIGDLADAEIWLVQLDQIQLNHSIQIDLRNDIKAQIALKAEAKIKAQKEQERLLKIENSLTQANEGEKLLPLNYNKIKDLYYRVLELDPNNARATAGLGNLVDILLGDADAALRKDNLGNVQLLLRNAEDIEPTNKRLSSIKLALETKLASQAVESVVQTVTSEDTDPDIETASTAQTENVENETLASLGDVTILKEVSAEEVAARRFKKELESGIQAYYDGDYNKSFELLFPLAEEGIARAQFRIGVMYRYGRSVSKNGDLSEKWFTKALPAILRMAQQGIAWAQTDLGTVYELGISLKQDFSRAAHWYQQAAEQDYAGAQTNLGVLFANGEGVNYSRSKAVFWLKKAAIQGDLVAIENLRIMGVQL